LLLSIGLALGSWIAIVPILLMVPFMVRRILIEERMLASALPGYANYTQRVRSRIVPGIVVSACMGRHA
jgi:protein-S-isoprenylcysteine O-methyltransferase Ste14